MLFTKQQLDNFVRVFTFLLFIACILGFLTGCAGMQIPDITAENAFVCRETDGTGGASVFMGNTRIRTIIVPEGSTLTIDEWLQVADRICPQTDQSVMINALREIAESENL